MYCPAHFAQTDSAEIRALIRRVALAELITWTGHGIEASSIPMLFDETTGDHGALLGHFARANPQWKTYDATAEALAIFRDYDAYVSPAWYASKADDERVVPTWNYLTVHVRGQLILHDDHDWKRALLERLTTTHEAANPAPWAISDAPAKYIESMIRAVVGVELRIERIDAKWKLSQNRAEVDVDGVIEHLATGDARQHGVAEHMRSLRSASGADSAR
ncbi:MAG: FMN-binding negative transcriptional regulator [Acidimicrobiales bacterium]